MLYSAQTGANVTEYHLGLELFWLFGAQDMLDTSPNTFWLSIFFLILNEKEEKLYIIWI